MTMVSEQGHAAAAAESVQSVPRAGKRKGRRRASLARLRAMGIVEAAVALARSHGVEAATASEVLTWFLEADYRTRTGLPSRNSIYVSLRRAADQHEFGIEREEGGLFRFGDVS